MYCIDCQVPLTRALPVLRARKDGWIQEHWFPAENWKCLQCDSCNFFVESDEKTWEELEEEAIATGLVKKEDAMPPNLGGISAVRDEPTE